MPRSVFDEKRKELELHELQMGTSRGRLAVSLDMLTDALALVGQHGVYCQSARQPGKPGTLAIHAVLAHRRQRISQHIERHRKSPA